MAAAAAAAPTPTDKPLPELVFDEITRRLAEYKLDDLSQILIEQNAVIAGSFPLQCATGKTFENSDIDIFVEQKNAQPFHDYFADEFSVIADDKDDGDKTEYDHAIISKITTYWASLDESSDDTLDESFDIRKYAIPSAEYPFTHGGVRWWIQRDDVKWGDVPEDINSHFIKIQIIELPNDDNPITHVVREFDIDICKITYTGAAVLYPLLIEKAISGKATLNRNANAYIKENLRRKKQEQRAWKYEQRNFTVITKSRHDSELWSNPLVKSAGKS